MGVETEAPHTDTAEIQRRVRLVVLLDAAERAGLTPVAVGNLHTLAFLTNVLAPVWDMHPMDGRLLKRREGPFYAPLQHDLDRLVGVGVALITRAGHVQNVDGKWRLDGLYEPNHDFTDRLIEAVERFPEERALMHFVREVTLAVSALTDADLSHASREDATYADPLVDYGSVVDFAEWRHVNYSANAAQHIARFLPHWAAPTTGEKLHLYVRHLARRLHGSR